MTTRTYGLWLVSQHWASGRYPCRCRLGKRCRTSITDPDGHRAYWCPCWGRLDLDGLPARCCAPRHPIHAGTMAAQGSAAHQPQGASA